MHTDYDMFQVLTAVGITASAYGLPMESLVLKGREDHRTAQARDMAIYLALTTLGLSQDRVAHLFNVSAARVKQVSDRRYAGSFRDDHQRLGIVLQWVLNMAEFSSSQKRLGLEKLPLPFNSQKRLGFASHMNMKKDAT